MQLITFLKQSSFAGIWVCNNGESRSGLNELIRSCPIVNILKSVQDEIAVYI